MCTWFQCHGDAFGTTENACFRAFITLRSQFHLHHCFQRILTEIVSKITPNLGLVLWVLRPVNRYGYIRAMVVSETISNHIFSAPPLCSVFYNKPNPRFNKGGRGSARITMSATVPVLLFACAWNTTIQADDISVTFYPGNNLNKKEKQQRKRETECCIVKKQ